MNTTENANGKERQNDRRYHANLVNMNQRRQKPNKEEHMERTQNNCGSQKRRHPQKVSENHVPECVGHSRMWVSIGMNLGGMNVRGGETERSKRKSDQYRIGQKEESEKGGMPTSKKESTPNKFP